MTRTAPDGCSRTSPIICASSPPGARLQGVKRGVRILRRDHCEKLSFVRNVQWVETEQFASAANGIAHGNRFFDEHDSKSAVAGQFIQRSGHATARRVAHPANAGPSRICQGFDQREDRASVGTKIGFEIKFAARQKNRDAMIADADRREEFCRRREPISDRSSVPAAGGQFQSS